jgi:hypothetical protein
VEYFINERKIKMKYTVSLETKEVYEVEIEASDANVAERIAMDMWEDGTLKRMDGLIDFISSK